MATQATRSRGVSFGNTPRDHVATTIRVVGYIRCSTSEQADSGLGLAAQRTTIAAACTARGWELVEMLEDAGASGKSMEKRPALAAALELVESGGADCLVVAKLDRLSRSLVDFAGVMERAHQNGWSLVALDLGVDTTTPAGQLVASIMASFAEYERRIIILRTKDALAEKRAQGVKLGRPRQLPEEVAQRIVDARDRGDSFAAIADALNRDGTATAQGGARWHPSTVRNIVRR